MRKTETVISEQPKRDELARLVVEAIRDSGLSQRWLAEQAGCHESTISYLVHGQSNISHQLAADILRVLGLELVFEIRPIKSYRLPVSASQRGTDG